MPVPKTDTPEARLLIRDHVLDKIRTAILDGTLEPGERLHDEDLINWIGVSRTPIREALSSLANEGLVEMAPNRYTRVALPHPDEVLDAIRTLGVIIGGVVRITVPVLTQQQRDTAKRRLTTEIDHLQADGTARFILDVDGAYQAWLDRCPNPSLVDVGNKVVHGLAYKLRVNSIDELIPAPHLIDCLTEFRTAITDNDPIAAELAIEAAHMLDRPTTN
jgi:DNA-binding GntR family transcriptional regulator